MKKHRKMSALQRKYFGKGHARVSSAPKRKKSVMKVAKKKGSKKGYARRGFGGLKSMIAPIGAGIADSYLDGMLPVRGVGATAIGMLMHDATLKTIGLYEIGGSIGNIIPLPGIGGGNGGLL